MLQKGSGWYSREVHLQSLLCPALLSVTGSNVTRAASFTLCLSDRFSQWEALAGAWKSQGGKFNVLSPFRPHLASPAIAASPLDFQLLIEAPSLGGPGFLCTPWSLGCCLLPRSFYSIETIVISCCHSSLALLVLIELHGFVITFVTNSLY